MGVQVTPLYQPVVRHSVLGTTFTGIQHALSTAEIPVHQYRGIKYAAFPGRFHQSKLFSAYHSRTDATRYGPVCPQPKGPTIEEELFGFAEDEFPVQNLKQIESECLNLNITCPGGLTRESRIPVMLWIHGGGHRGSGSHWLCDGGALVQSSVRMGKPIILVTMNYRLGLLGFAASPKLAADGEDGIGNYGLRDQRRAMEWVHRFITDFGGNPNNVTVFGESTGAADVLCHLSSSANASHPLFQRAIVQSPIIDHNIPNVHVAGVHLSRVMSALNVHSIDELRKLPVEKLVMVGTGARAVDDGIWFSKGWKQTLGAEDHPSHHLHIPETKCAVSAQSMIERHLAEHHGTPLHSKVLQMIQHQPSPPPHTPSPIAHQPIIIGDCGFEAFVYSMPAREWTSASVVRRIKAICQSLGKASALLRAYDISAHTPEEELEDHILDLINDARFAWPTHCVAETYRRLGSASPKIAAPKGAATAGAYRYVFDQEAPRRGIPHHAVDLLYLFDTARPDFSASDGPDASADFPESFDSDSDDGESFDNSLFEGNAASVASDDAWTTPVVDSYTYARVRDAVQSRWCAFAHGEAPWAEDKAFVFGPEGETGERSMGIFEGRRRMKEWHAVLQPLGREIVHKIGLELSNGPSGRGMYAH
ncbi:alpha/beta-hydrolase [Auriscalpium vulgare]|uniref:Alpha/beta-hydrolase n=1 Tax=Auriscalpium vulgare TaxID=40419 RepID=A0ACB8S9J2_9AGAM|nr:alpha/beta-hydrolase [Auriscalpium vulgare]